MTLTTIAITVVAITVLTTFRHLNLVRKLVGKKDEVIEKAIEAAIEDGIPGIRDKSIKKYYENLFNLIDITFLNLFFLLLQLIMLLL